jgi:hypothetical protein
VLGLMQRKFRLVDVVCNEPGVFYDCGSRHET